MNVGDKVKIICGEFQGRVGQIKARHMNAVPSEMKNIKAGVTIDNRNNETLYSLLLEGDKDIMYFPKSCLESITD
jgi:transcription antitermination factor NusG